MIVVIARPVPWPTAQARPARASLRLRWDAVQEDTGEVLAVATEYPLADAALVLAVRGVSPATAVTMKHEGAEHFSFKPMALGAAAAPARKRAAGIAELRLTNRQRTAVEAAA